MSKKVDFQTFRNINFFSNKFLKKIKKKTKTKTESDNGQTAGGHWQTKMESR